MTKRYDVESRSAQNLRLRKLALRVRQDRDRLHRLAQAHLVRQDPVQVRLVQAVQPVQPLELVVAQPPVHERVRLASEALRNDL